MGELEPILVSSGELRNFVTEKRMVIEFPYSGVLWAIDVDKLGGKWTVYLHYWGADGRDMDDVVAFEEECDLWESVVLHEWIAPEDDMSVLLLVSEILADRDTLKRIIDEKGAEHIKRVREAREKYEQSRRIERQEGIH